MKSDYPLKKQTAELHSPQSVAFFVLNSCTRRKSYEQVAVVGLYLRLVCRLVTDGSTAPLTAMNDYVALLRVGERLHRTEYTSAGVCSVSRIYINVKGAETEWAVIARGVAEREHLLAAALTDEALIVFLKSFIFHKASQGLFSYAEFRENVCSDVLGYLPARELTYRAYCALNV